MIALILLPILWLAVMAIVDCVMPVKTRTPAANILSLPAPIAPLLLKEAPYRTYEYTSESIKALFKTSAQSKLEINDTTWRGETLTKTVKPQTAKIHYGLYHFKTLHELIKLIPDNSDVKLTSHNGNPPSKRYAGDGMPIRLECRWFNHTERGKWTLNAGYNVTSYTLTAKGNLSKGHLTGVETLPANALNIVLGVEVLN